VFKEDYKKYNDEIKVDSLLKDRIMEAVDKVDHIPEKKNRGKMFYFTRIGLPVAACVLVLVLVANIFLQRDIRIENGTISNFHSYDEIYNSIENSVLENYANDIVFNGLRGEDFLEFEASSDSNTSKGNGYSETNIQVEGVDEADIVKTDGKYIYIFSYNRVKIVEAAGEKTKLVSSIKIGSDPSYRDAELYLYKDLLVVVYSDKDNKGYFTDIEVYDVTNPEHPEQKGVLSQQGNYVSSRIVDGRLYVFSSYNIYTGNIAKDQYDTYIPKVSANDKEYFVPAENIYCCPSLSGSTGRNYLVISSVDTENADKFIDTKSVLGLNGDIYMNQDNLFIGMYNGCYGTDDSNVTDTTAIIKFEVKNGIFNRAASCIVQGKLLNQFSMDEYKGHLRVATTVSYYEVRQQLGSDGNLPVMYEYFYDISESNDIYVLNEKLEEVGSVTGLAENESIYSVRFDGDKGYVVTFEQVDPLFEIDLSNPKAPAVTDSLKITGVSRYLHLFKDDLLFGIGSNGTVNGLDGRLKLSMFKVNDDGENVEIHKYVTKHDTNSPAFNNHKALLIDADKNIIGFPMSSAIDEVNHKVIFGQCYTVFSYDEETGFNQELVVFDNDDERDYGDTVRGLYINDVLYVVFTNKNIKVFDMDNFEFIAETDIY